MIINVEAEVQRCHFVVSDWCSTAVILQLPCESARLFVSILQSGDNFEKYSIRYPTDSEFRLMNMFFPGGFSFLIRI